MLHRFTNQEITVVRNNYGSCAMMTVADAICKIFDSQLQNFSLWPEELFVWSADIVDDVKEKGDQYMERISSFWKEHYRVFRGFDKSIPQDELQLSVALVLYVPIIMLQNSGDNVHRYMGRLILNSVSQNYEAWEGTFLNVAASCKQLSSQISEWINGFMALDNDQYLSDEIEDLLKPLTSGELRPKAGDAYQERRQAISEQIRHHISPLHDYHRQPS